MRCFFLFVALLLVLTKLSSQEDSFQLKLDSLNTIYEDAKDDTERINVLKELYDAVIMRDPTAAKTYLMERMGLAEDLKNGQLLGDTFLDYGKYYYYNGKRDSARVLYKKALEVYSENELFKDQALTNHAIAVLDLATGDLDNALKRSKKNIKLLSQLKDSIALGREYTFYADIHQNKGNYEIAYENVLKSLDIFNRFEHPTFKAQALHLLASLESINGNFKKANLYGKEAYAIYKSQGDKLFQSLEANGIGQSYMKIGDIENARKYLDTSLALATEMAHPALLGVVKRNLARVLVKTEDFDEGITILEEAAELHRASNRPVEYIRSLYFLGEAYNNRNYPRKALFYYDSAMNEIQKTNSKSQLPELLAARSSALEKLNNFEGALQDLKVSKTLNDSINTDKKKQQIEQLRALYETERKEAEIALQEEEIKTLNEKSRADNLQKGLYAGGMASALALFGLSVFGYRQRIKRNRVAREKQEEIYKQEIEHKKKELASQTLHLVQKNTFLEELKENLENLKNSPEKFKMEFRRIVMLLKKEKASDKDWETFKTYFSEVHNDFDQKLKTLYADISEKEIRLAAFLRMNLTTKEIAATMNVLPDSILKSKYRLKKKLGLDREMDLTNFLNTL